MVIARLHELAAEVAAYPGDDVGRPVLTDVVVPLELRVGGAELRFFSISAAVESAMDVTVDELRIEASTRPTRPPEMPFSACHKGRGPCWLLDK